MMKKVNVENVLKQKYSFMSRDVLTFVLINYLKMPIRVPGLPLPQRLSARAYDYSHERLNPRTQNMGRDEKVVLSHSGA